MIDDVGLRIVLQDETETKRPTQARSDSDVGFNVPKPAGVAPSIPPAPSGVTKPTDVAEIVSSSLKVRERGVTQLLSAAEVAILEQKKLIETQSAQEKSAREKDEAARKEEVERSKQFYRWLTDRFTSVLLRPVGVNPSDVRQAAAALSKPKEEEPTIKEVGIDPAKENASRPVGANFDQESKSWEVTPPAVSFTPGDNPKPAEPKYDPAHGWSVPGPEFRMPKEVGSAPPSAASVATESAEVATVSESSAAGGAAGGAAISGLALAGVAVAAGLAVVGLTKFANATTERARELGKYSPEIAGASARADVREIMADIREAQQLGTQYSKTTDEWSEIKALLRDILIPIKRFLLETLNIFLEDIRVFLEFAKPFLQISMETGLAMMDVIRDIATFRLGMIATDLLKHAENIAKVLTGKDKVEMPDLLEQFFASADPLNQPKYERKSDTGFGEGRLNIPAFAGM